MYLLKFIRSEVATFFCELNINKNIIFQAPFFVGGGAFWQRRVFNEGGGDIYII